MKKILFVLISMLSIVVANASTYRVNVDLPTKAVSIIQDNKVIQGTSETGSMCVAQVTLTKVGDVILAQLTELTAIPMSITGTVDKNGNMECFGFTLQDNRAKQAFKEAMKYLNKTDKPIIINLYR